MQLEHKPGNEAGKPTRRCISEGAGGKERVWQQVANKVLII